MTHLFCVSLCSMISMSSVELLNCWKYFLWSPAIVSATVLMEWEFDAISLWLSDFPSVYVIFDVKRTQDCISRLFVIMNAAFLSLSIQYLPWVLHERYDKYEILYLSWNKNWFISMFYPWSHSCEKLLEHRQKIINQFCCVYKNFDASGFVWNRYQISKVSAVVNKF